MKSYYTEHDDQLFPTSTKDQGNINRLKKSQGWQSEVNSLCNFAEYKATVETL